MAWARRRTALTSNDVVAVIARSPRNAGEEPRDQPHLVEAVELVGAVPGQLAVDVRGRRCLRPTTRPPAAG